MRRVASLFFAAIIAVIADNSLAGHSSPMRNAGKLLAVADLFGEHCRSFGKVDTTVLDNELKRAGIAPADRDNDPAIAELRGEYVTRYKDAILKEGESSFCLQALEAFADKEPRILVRLKKML